MKKRNLFFFLPLFLSCSLTGHSESAFFVSNFRSDTLTVIALDVYGSKDSVPQVLPNETVFISKTDNVLGKNIITPEETFKDLKIFKSSNDSLICDQTPIRNELWRKEVAGDNFVKYFIEIN